VLTKLSYLIDNPWSNSLERAKAAGGVLADVLINRQLGVRPVSLIGFSLGARVIFYALLELAKAKAFGVVQDVYFMGATVTASVKTWNQVRSVVSGRFVNAYATNDWLLAYLFRASHAGMATVAGLRPVPGVDDIENVDVSDIVVGHMSYRPFMPLLLKRLGFRTTADHFDEPDSMERDEEVAETTEETTTERPSVEKAKGKKSFSFLRKKSSRVSTPTTESPRGSKDEDEDLPPRVEEGGDPTKGRATPAEEIPPEPSTTLETHVKDEPAIQRKAGFDLEQIKKELEKAEAKPVEERIAESFPTVDPAAGADMPTVSGTASMRPRRGDSVGPSSWSDSPTREIPPASSTVDSVNDDLRQKWSQSFFHTSPNTAAGPASLSDDTWSSSNPFYPKPSGSFASASSAALPSLTFADANGDLDTTSSSSLPLTNGASDYSISFNPFASASTTSFKGLQAHNDTATLSFAPLDGTISFPSAPGTRPHLRDGGDGGPPPASAAAFASPLRGAAANPWSDDQPPPPPVRARTGAWP
jgi:hypothetical protein